VKLKKVHLTNFKRFTDLTIDQIPETSKLVLVIGANGSGKSCVFDAFNFCHIYSKYKDLSMLVEGDSILFDYYLKDRNQDAKIKLHNKAKDDILNSTIFSIKRQLQTNQKPIKTFTLGTFEENNINKLYGRTSFRQLSKLIKNDNGKTETLDDPIFFIDRDNRFENDLGNIYRSIVKDIFKDEQSGKEIKEKYIIPINQALENIFGNSNGTKLKLLEIIPPFDDVIPQITFQKGEHQFHYNYLSAGEKEVFNILINLLNRIPQYQNTIYYLDELDLHLNTKIQFHLLKEITENWIPKNCQLWTASHSLGFIEYARQSDQASIIDFDDLDFDVPQVLTPVPKENPEVYEIAVGKDFLPALFKDMQIIFVENKDKDYYGSIGLDKTVFVSGNDRNSVFYKTVNTDFYGLVDRDWLSDDDMNEIKEHYPRLYILELYSIENYLYHPENLQEYYDSIKDSFDKATYIQQIADEKNKVVDDLVLRLSSVRTSYKYFDEPEFNGKPLQDRFKNKDENFEQSKSITNCLKNNEFEIFYPFIPMKDYCTNISQRQNIAKTHLTKTKWFKTQIEELLKKQPTS